MGFRDELFTTQVQLDKRSYFFNVKENRNGDVFLQIVESKKGEGADFDRHQIAVFAEDMQQFFTGMDQALKFVEKERKARSKAKAEKKAAKDAKFARSADGTRKIYRKKGEDPNARNPNDGIKRTGRVHVVSKRPAEPSSSEEI